MVRISLLVILSLVVSAHVAFAQLSVNDIKDEAKRIDQRTLPAYQHALENRDIFASIHDSIHHPEYKELQRLHGEYARLRAEVDKATGAHDRDTADKKLDELTAVASQLSEQVPLYIHSSEEGVQKIQIGLGALAVVIGGLVVLIFKRRSGRQPSARRSA
jgi:hypothetical protein